MGNKIPLTVYRDGERFVIGEAEIEADGTVKANITDEVLELRAGVKTDGYSLGVDLASKGFTEVTVIPRPMVMEGHLGQTKEEALREIDRNARAYGWEIGRGQDPARTIKYSDENPFLDPDWRDKLIIKKD